MNKIASLSLILILGVCVSCQPAEVPLQSGTPSPAPLVTETRQPIPLTSTPALEKTFETDPSGLLVFYSDRDGNPEIYSMQADGSGLTRLTNDPAFDDSPAISPDGKKVAFLSARNDPNPQSPNLKYEIYIMDINGDHLQRLTNTEAAEDHPAWSPDGDKISFDADYDGDGFYEIYTIHPDGTNLTRLTSNPANDQFADWSPDGLQIAFASDRNGNWDIFVVDADGSNQKSLTNSPDWELFPAWSPDGSLIAFNGLAPRSRNTDVYLMNADGSDIRQLTDSPGFDENPAWSPDGSQIVFQTRRDGNFELYLMQPDGSQQRPLAVSPADELWPSWGKSTPVLFERSDQELSLRETFQAALGDLDGDGDLDAVFANPMSNNAGVWLNDGSGFFVDTDQQLTQYGHGVGLADFDQDGDLDVIIGCHQFLTPTKVYLNDGSGFMKEAGQDFGDQSISANEVNLLDLNGDGFMDAHVMYYAPGGLPDKVYLNDGQANFHDSGLILDEEPIAWGDLDGDGDIDYFGKRPGSGYIVQLNDGSGNFSAGWEMEDEQATVGGIALADFDADGDLDALVANGFRETGSFPSRLFWNDGNGQFTDSGQIMNESLGAELAVGDLDLDGDLDVFVANMDRPNEVWLYENGGFVDSGLRLGKNTDMSGKATLGDLDGDGDLDIIVGRFRGGAEIWFNQTN